MARRHCGLGAEDWGLASALYEPGSLGKGFTVFEPPFYHLYNNNIIIIILFFKDLF